MEYSLWIILFGFISFSVQGAQCLQGVPTWICLGLKSPFIEFKAEIEVLSNVSVSLNATSSSDNNSNGRNTSSSPSSSNNNNNLQNLDSIDHSHNSNSNSNNNYNYNKELIRNQNVIKSELQDNDVVQTDNPIILEDINSKKEVTIIELKEAVIEATNSQNHRTSYGTTSYGNPSKTNSNTNMEKKYIIPLALKNPTSAPTKKQPFFQDSSSTNIDDLKRHILMLQNLTKNDENFQSKFVVFPNLKRNTTSSTDQPKTQQNSRSDKMSAGTLTIVTPSTIIDTSSSSSSPFTTSTTSTPSSTSTTLRTFFFRVNSKKIFSSTLPTSSTRRTPPSLALSSLNLMSQDNSYIKDMLRGTSTNDYYKEYHRNSDEHDTNADMEFEGDKDILKQQKSEKITIVPQVFLQNDQMPMNDDSFESSNERPPDHIAEQQSNDGGYVMGRKIPETNYYGGGAILRTISTTTVESITRKSGARKSGTKKSGRSRGGGDRRINRQRQNSGGQQRQRNRNKRKQLCNRIKKRNCGGLIDDPYVSSSEQMRNDDSRKLYRIPRSHEEEQYRSFNKDFNYGTTSSDNINLTNSTKDNIELDPDLCYTVNGLSNGQQKLCVLHTSIMPAISRGARSAIQECRHQFKNRRWNCSTTEDETVFGPITSTGSPEMAFIHALAAAGAASFIARACRDGQLASCGCSRSTRPRQLHADWTWGGCGDDLEFGYKFSQNFIDVREKERKRGARGLISVPQKYSKLNDKFGTENDTVQNNLKNMARQQNHFKTEDLLELQEKITKEILSSKLQEKEMHELQAKINHEIFNSKVFSLNLENPNFNGVNGRRTLQRNIAGGGVSDSSSAPSLNRIKIGASYKARSMMNLHNNEAGRRAVIKKSKITCKCHGVSGSCSLITCWQQLTSMREIGDFLREKYDEATQVKLNKRNRLQVKDSRYKVPTALDLVYLDDSPDWCRINRQLQWSGTHNRICNKTSSGLDGCEILCCGRGYNTRKIIVKERCNCKFEWCCRVECQNCVKTIEEYTCK